MNKRTYTDSNTSVYCHCTNWYGSKIIKKNSYLNNIHSKYSTQQYVNHPNSNMLFELKINGLES